MLSAHPADNRFLIVDNYPFGRDTLRRALLSMGAEQVDIAVSASIAISMCKNMDYDMVLADYDLGEGRNGQQLLEELRSQQLLNTVSAFIIITSETTRDIVLSTLEYQPDDYLVKPYPQNLLTRRVRRLLRLKSNLHEVFQSIDAKNYVMAAQDAERYLEANDEFRGNGLRMLAELYQQTGNLERAKKIYDTELAARDSDWARLGLAKIYMQEQQLQEAEALFAELINQNYMYIEAYENLSRIYLEQEQVKKAEDIMARAVLVSPLSIRRQQWYARICESNNHFDAAINAWKSVIKTTKNSKYESADHHLNLSRCLSDSCDHHNNYNDAMARDALKNIDIMRDRYHVYGDNELQSLFIESRIFHGKGNTTQSKESLRQANKMFEKNPSAYSEQSQLELAKSLSQSGDNTEAEKILKRLVARSKDDDILAKADKVLDEPISENGKARIVKLNRQGIKAFKAGDYAKAVTFFKNAQLFFPKNIELNLNLVQALIKSIKSSKNERDRENWLTDAEQCMVQIRDIPYQHKKFENYKRLQKELETIHSEEAA